MDLLGNHHPRLFTEWNPGDVGPSSLHGDEQRAFFDWLRPRLLAIVGKRRLVVVPGNPVNDGRQWNRLRLPGTQLAERVICREQVKDDQVALVVVACRNLDHPHPPNRDSGIEIFLRDASDGELETLWVDVNEWYRPYRRAQREASRPRRRDQSPPRDTSSGGLPTLILL